MENLNYRQTPPKTWLVESILVTIFCCLPFGIVGIINASQVESKFSSGDYNGADYASKQAGKWTMIGFWTGIAITIISIGFSVIIMLLGLSGEFFKHF